MTNHIKTRDINTVYCLTGFPLRLSDSHSPPPTVFLKTTLTQTITLNTHSPPPTVFLKTTSPRRSHSTLSHHHQQSFSRLPHPDDHTQHSVTTTNSLSQDYLTQTITLNTQSPPPTVFLKTTSPRRSHSTLSHHHQQSFSRLHSPRRSHSTLSHHHQQSFSRLPHPDDHTQHSTVTPGFRPFILFNTHIYNDILV